MSEHVHADEAIEGFDNGVRPHIDRKQIWIIWVWLLVLTVLEVGIVYVDMPKGLLISGLCAMAMAKAGIVALFYMHLKYETKMLQWTVAIPMALPAFYALVLIAEAMWRQLDYVWRFLP
jgi:cytochrome c oxidase subunit 4